MMLLAVCARHSFTRHSASAPCKLNPGFSALLRSSKCNFGGTCTISGPQQLSSPVPVKQRRLPGRFWTQQEEETLREEIAKQLADASGRNGRIRTLPNRASKCTIGWGRVAAQLPGRTPEGCHKKWHYRLNPSIRREPWSPEEDRRLMALVHEALAKSLQENPSIGRTVKSNSAIRWKDIARLMDNGRTLLQCWDRWHVALRDYTIVGDDVVVDDSVIVSEAGADGSTSAPLPAGSCIVKHRTGRWTLDEDRLLLSGFAAEPRRWTRIAERFVLTRNEKQCQMRWKYMNKKRNVTSVSEVEDPDM